MTMQIGPNRCHSCGGEYGKHDKDCWSMAAKQKSTDPINQAVIDKIAGRASVGRKKYGVTMARADLSELEWLELAQQEAMDLAVYLEKLIQMKKP